MFYGGESYWGCVLAVGCAYMNWQSYHHEADSFFSSVPWSSDRVDNSLLQCPLIFGQGRRLLLPLSPSLRIGSQLMATSLSPLLTRDSFRKALVGYEQSKL